MRIQDMTRKQFEALPHRGWKEDKGKFSSLIILPSRRLHDSGYRCLEFILVNDKGEPICKAGGCADVIHIDGIGGYGKGWSSVPVSIPPKGWSMDCLKKSGLMRIFLDGDMTIGTDLSSFEVFGERRIT
jgi:hypothetical protein